MTRTELKLEKK